MSWKRVTITLMLMTILLITGGLLVPEHLLIPVQGATPADWNARTFWYRPWGKSGVHRGIDIFAREGTPVRSASAGLVVFRGRLLNGGNAVAVLGPKWRIHYYAHLRSIAPFNGWYVKQGQEIGTVGTTGNAAGKPPHLHYAIISQIPYVWHYKPERFCFDRMFYLNPHKALLGSRY